MNYKILLLSLLLLGCASGPSFTEDKYLALEEIESQKSLDWVQKESRITQKILSQEPGFQESYQRVLSTLEDKDKILYVKKRGTYVYNLWKDKKNPRGLWRRTPYKSYVYGKKIFWETVLDIDKLSKKDRKKWVFKGVVSLTPKEDRIIIRLSNGGKDAVYLREFSLKTKKFLNKGFGFKEAKNTISPIDLNTLLMATTETLSVTDSGYARELRLVKRGELVDKSQVLMSVPKDHIGVNTYLFRNQKQENINLVFDNIDFFNSKKYIYRDQGLLEIPVPESSQFYGIHGNKIILSIKENTKFKGIILSSGELVYVELNSDNTFSKIKSLFKPLPHQSVSSLMSTKNYLVLVTMENVSKKGYRISFLNGKMVKQPLKIKGELALIDNNLQSDNIILQTHGFLTPKTVYAYNVQTGLKRVLQNGKRYFSKSKYAYKQSIAISKDGTKVPFYIVHRKDMKLNGKNPTLMYGYGGFEVTYPPFYLKVRVNEWVDKGGVFVLANIRGGGEFGPDWHKAAQKFNKRKSYEDFAAIAKKLHQDKVTAPKHLGISGGSNGGLLVGASTVLYPDLYGAVFCAVPLLDMLRYDRLLAGSSWIAEYGDPKIKKEREYIKTYSPYQNVRKGVEYPPMFFYTSTYDDRVHPGHARKMYAKMKDQGHQVYYYENSEGGHAGASDLKQRALLNALKFQFLWKELK